MIEVTSKSGKVEYFRFKSIAEMMANDPCMRWEAVKKIEEISPEREKPCGQDGKAAPIEVYRYEPIPDKPPFLRYAGTRPVGEVFRELKRRLRTEGLLPDEYFDLVYPDVIRSDPNAPFPEYLMLACYAVTGKSEGHYVHVDAVVSDPSVSPVRTKFIPVFLGKTFQGMDFAYRVAAACARHLGA